VTEVALGAELAEHLGCAPGERRRRKRAQWQHCREQSSKGVQVGRETISRVTDSVLEDIAA